MGSSQARKNLIPVEPAPRRPNDVTSEERRVEQQLLAHGAAYRQRNKTDEAWPDFGARASLLKKGPPRMKQFRDPESVFVVRAAPCRPVLSSFCPYLCRVP